MSYKITVIEAKTPPVQTVADLPLGTRFQVENNDDWYMRSDESNPPATNLTEGHVCGSIFAGRLVARVLPPEAVLQIGPEEE